MNKFSCYGTDVKALKFVTELGEDCIISEKKKKKGAYEPNYMRDELGQIRDCT